MSSTDKKKTIVVVGATGRQGGSVARTFLSSPVSSRWRVRCITRNPSSEAARGLAALGADIVQADLSSLPSLVSAFSGAHAIYVNTDFWEVYRGALSSGKATDAEVSQLAYDTEVARGKNAALAASQTAGLERYIYSAFGSMKVASGGKYARCYHIEAKAAVVSYIVSELPDLDSRTSYIYASGYCDNALLYPHKVPLGTLWVLWVVAKLPFLVHLLPRPGVKKSEQTEKKNANKNENNRNQVSGGDDGGGNRWYHLHHRHQYLMMLPGRISTSLPTFIPHVSTGGYVRCLVEDEEAGTKLLAVDWWLSMEQGLSAWEKVTNRKARFLQMPVWLLCRITGVREEVMEGGAFLTEFPYMCDVTDWIEPKHLKNPPPVAMTWEEYLRSRDIKELLE
ncbi:hypothetical protein PV08_08638 [Exophiala spinifera]|uniref:NmrA-like domain-containing protein n=1 Tax=Exophiala spinifera TaxID=91928 RepID=A0A0D2B443_9EURO|nr:uncharacterized protein PV08_08638 [Exophiala spinifera]KIW13450.1 hypothetical protein PV08_08638 [Exophiala spinifera]